MASSYMSVLAAVRAYIGENPGPWSLTTIRWDLHKEVPGSCYSGGMLADTYCTQVYRAVNALVSEGALVKAGERRDARYMTPAVQQARQAEAGKFRAERQAEHERWRDARMRLAALGYADISTSATMIRLELPDWQDIITRLEGGNHD